MRENLMQEFEHGEYFLLFDFDAQQPDLQSKTVVKGFHSFRERYGAFLFYQNPFHKEEV